MREVLHVVNTFIAEAASHQANWASWISDSENQAHLGRRLSLFGIGWHRVRKRMPWGQVALGPLFNQLGGRFQKGSEYVGP